ncbi:hypothetical protein [uncultured Psychroserpens sp.]|uniref:hypothetical protein n=1 Tax=uncultured Psychroserpens sp. TaxID=255436 RepID=UPI0026075BD1|nr:hypothetical protein [uncultured Psychroserpens sp.]
MLKKVAVVLVLLCLYTCEEIIAVEDISEMDLTILAPTNNATLDNTAINFSWQPIEFADSYQLQIATPNFETPLQFVEDTLLTGSSFTKSLLSNEYQWRVRAINSAYETAYTTQNLSIED